MTSVSLRLVHAEPRSDEALCRAFLAGDRQAFGELFERHHRLVFQLSRRYAVTADEARDLTQRAFLHALEAARRSLPRLLAKDSALPFKAWLIRIAINLGKNQVRDAARWKRAPLSVIDGLSSGGDAHAALETAEAQALTRRAVLELPRRQREVFTLRIDVGLPFAEIAETLGISEGNAKSHFHHAVKRLRDEVAVLSSPTGSPT